MSKTILTKSQRDIPVLIDRSDAIRAGLVANYYAGRGSPNEVIGNEREVFVRGYLEAAYPTASRFSSGFVIDSDGNQTGQLDIIVEKLGTLSLPATAQGTERLHFAEMVSAVISVKSNLASQWKQVEREAERIKRLRVDHQSFFNVGHKLNYIPFFVVAYTGYKDPKTLDINTSLFGDMLHGMIILEERICWIKSRPGEWITTQDTSSFLRFMTILHDDVATKMQVGESIWRYVCEIETD